MFVAERGEHSPRFVLQIPCAMRALNRSVILQVSKTFLKCLAAVRAGDWNLVGLVHGQILASGENVGDT